MDMFAIYYDNRLLVILKNMPNVRPLPTAVLDWYAENYAFDRKKLSWSAVSDIDCAGMKAEDFK